MSTIGTVDAEPALSQGLLGIRGPPARRRRSERREAELASWLPETFGQYFDRNLLSGDATDLSFGGETPGERLGNLDGHAHGLHCASDRACVHHGCPSFGHPEVAEDIGVGAADGLLVRIGNGPES